MNVLHIIPTLGMGGAEKLLVDSLKYYQENGIKCTLVVLSNYDNVYENSIREQGVELFISKEKSVYHWRNIQFIRRVIQQNRFDVIHCHLYAAQLFTPIALKFCDYRPLLITTEHSTSNRRRNNPVFKLLDQKMYKSYDKIICISEAVQQELVKYLPRLWPKLIVINNGIEVEPFLNAEPVNWHEELEQYNDEKIVLMVASLRHQKDPFTLIEAAELLGAEYRIVFVGNGELLNEAKEYAKSKEISNVVFLGERQDVPSLMKATDVFVLSSHWEGFGLVVAEAAVTGVPVVASNVAGLSEVVLDLGGQLFERQNAYQLAEKVKVGLQYPSVFKEKYHINNMVLRYIELYRELK